MNKDVDITGHNTRLARPSVCPSVRATSTGK